MNNIASRKGVLAGGHWIVDHVKIIDAWPSQDALASVSRTYRGTGGCPYNLLKGLFKLQCGFPLYAAGLIGDDADGDWIANDCRASGIDTQSLHKIPAACTAFTDVMTVESTGRRTFFYHPGANNLLAEKDFDLANSNARFFQLGYLTLFETMDALDTQGRTPASCLFEKASNMGMITAADLVSNPAADFPTIVNPSLPFLDYLFLNEFEAAKLLGMTPQTIENGIDSAWAAEAAHKILQRGVRQAVILHMSQGAVCVTKAGNTYKQGSVNVPKELIRGTAGAGDAFCTGCVFGIHEGWSVEDYLELAVCAAATSLRDATCTESILPWQECLSEGRTLGFRDF